MPTAKLKPRLAWAIVDRYSGVIERMSFKRIRHLLGYYKFKDTAYDDEFYFKERVSIGPARKGEGDPSQQPRPRRRA